MPARLKIAAVCALVLLASACASATTAAAPPASGGAEVLHFEAPLLDGGTFRGASVAGKDVAFWFWAPW